MAGKNNILFVLLVKIAVALPSRLPHTMGIVWIMLFALCFLVACTGEPTPELVELATVDVSPTFPPPITPTAPPTHTATATASPTAEPTMTSQPLTEVVIAVQPIPAGYAIPPDALTVYELPVSNMTDTALDDLERVINQVALADIGCFEPIHPQHIARRTIGEGFRDLPGDCPQLPELARPIQLSEVVVAAQYIDDGTVITPEMIIVRSWPAALIPPDAITMLSNVVGQVSRRGILQEQVLRSGQFIEGD